MSGESNPAGRLHAVLLSARQCGAKDKMLEVWAVQFGVPASDFAGIMRGLVALSDAVDDVERRMRMLPGLGHDKYLAWATGVRAAINPTLFSNARDQVISGYVTDAMLATLVICDDLLGRSYAEQELAADQLADILADTNDLFDAIEASAIDEKLRLLLLEEIENVRRAIAVYRIHGVKGLVESLHSLMGMTFAQQPALMTAKSSAPGMIEKLGKFIKKTIGIVETADKAVKLSDRFGRTFAQLLQGNDDGGMIGVDFPISDTADGIQT